MGVTGAEAYGERRGPPTASKLAGAHASERPTTHNAEEECFVTEMNAGLARR